MSKQSVRNYWLLWLFGSAFLAVALSYALMTEGISKTMFMPGELSSGHHQLVDSCQSCHSSPFGGKQVLQSACIECHGDVRVKPFDSHPIAKFKDPRNADRLEKINALECVSCHVEHKPEITLKDGLTQPVDVCFHCHAEVAQERPSHEGMPFSSCKDSGCHNFHNNRALYTDFLVKHMDKPAHKSNPRLAAREFGDMLDEIIEYPRDKYPLTELTAVNSDAPDVNAVDANIIRDWLTTAHAKAGVNCSACHQVSAADGKPSAWQDSPPVEQCRSCHTPEVTRFMMGKHGMRLWAGLAPMTVAQARLPMRQDAGHQALTCNSCHGAHRFDTAYAAVEGCLQCHADDHSLAYKNSSHYTLWQQEQNNPARENTGVSCASCHMPRIDYDVNDWLTRKAVDHNQSANLSPNSKMIRSACLHCHGLGFSIDSLADKNLIKNNFAGASAVRVESIELARKDLQRYLKERRRLAQ